MTWVIFLIIILFVIAIVSFCTREESIGKVEIVETDGKYAVRQLGVSFKR